MYSVFGWYILAIYVIYVEYMKKWHGSKLICDIYVMNRRATCRYCKYINGPFGGFLWLIQEQENE